MLLKSLNIAKDLSRTFFMLLVALVLLLAETMANDKWVPLQRPTQKNLRSIFFEDSLKGWIGGDSGLILRTTNGGQSWNQQPTGLNTPIYCIHFTSPNIGYALAWELDNTPPNYYGTRYLTTSNGGINWNNLLFPDSNFFANSIYFRDPQNGYLCGTGGKIYFTTNAGQIWNLSEVDSGMVFGFPVEEIAFYNANSGYAVGGAFDIAGVIWKTSNSGRTWQTQIVGPEPVNDIHIFNDSFAIGAGGDFEYGSSRVVTNNSGGKWQYTEFGIFGIANSIAFRTEQEGWISLGIIDSFIVTGDRGLNWSLYPVPQQGRIYGIEFADSRNGWAIGNGGILLKFNPDVIGIEENETGIASGFELHQNYPNPFNPETNISYSLRKRAEITIEIYDMKGNLLAVPYKSFSDPGNHSIKFSSDGLPSGAYLYSMLADGERVSSRKMVILK